MKMADRLIDRIKAHRSAPDVYDAPTFEDMADRIEELMTAKENAYDAGFEAGQEYLKEELRGEGSQ